VFKLPVGIGVGLVAGTMLVLRRMVRRRKKPGY
jgi:hypothetical protein